MGEWATAGILRDIEREHGLLGPTTKRLYAFVLHTTKRHLILSWFMGNMKAHGWQHVYAWVLVLSPPPVNKNSKSRLSK